MSSCSDRIAYILREGNSHQAVYYFVEEDQSNI